MLVQVKPRGFQDSRRKVFSNFLRLRATMRIYMVSAKDVKTQRQAIRGPLRGGAKFLNSLFNPIINCDSLIDRYLGFGGFFSAAGVAVYYFL